jgi:hypothetical protein
MRFGKVGLTLGIQLILALSAFGQSGYKAETIGAAPADVPAGIQGTLNGQGVRVSSDQGATLCEVWLRKTLPTNPTPNPESDILYGALTEGALLGVLHFPNATTDFRSQTIKAGFYTLRFGLIPQDGNHTGASPYRDAFVLSPVTADKDPDKVLSFEDLVKMSQQASGTPHPGFLVGAPVNGGAFPSVGKDDSGNWNLQLKGHVSSGDLPLAFTVVGHWQG